ncbi:MAG: cupin domain-containing protein [Bacteroidetes bacterium]|nr:cupin domain-containing protein [Bacteroidota bacterium]
MKNPEAEKIIKSLNLLRHPEGGYFSEVYRSDEKANGLDERYIGDHVNYTSIYFLLNENDFSAFHRLKSDEIWHFYDGTALDIHIIGEDGKLETVTLGKDINKGESYQYLVKRGLYFAAEVRDKKSFALVGCTVAPGFEYEDFEMPTREELIKKYPQNEDIINRLSKNEL